MNIQTPPIQSVANRRLYAGIPLNIMFYADILRKRLDGFHQYVNIGETVRQMTQQYFYCENLPTHAPTDVYLGAVVAYTVNQETLPNEVRGAILTVVSDSQWDLHDYIYAAIQYPVGRNAPRESEYYYALDGTGRLMVYIPVGFEGALGVSGVPEIAVILSCYNTLPTAKRIAYGPAMVTASALSPKVLGM